MLQTMDENIRQPDKAFMDTLFTTQVNIPSNARRGRKKISRIIKNSQNNTNHQIYHHNNDNDNDNDHDLQLAEEQLIMHVINISLQQKQQEEEEQELIIPQIEEKEEVIVEKVMEEVMEKEVMERQELFIHSEKIIQRLNQIDKKEKLYQNILRYISLFVQSGKYIQVSTTEFHNIQTCLNHIRLSQLERQHILNILTCK